MIACELTIRRSLIKRFCALCVLVALSLTTNASSFSQDNPVLLLDQPSVAADQPSAKPEVPPTGNTAAAGEPAPANEPTPTDAVAPKSEPEPAGEQAASTESTPAEVPAAQVAAEAEPDEATVKDWISVVVDNSLGLQNRELPAYRYYVNKVNHLSYEDLKSNAVVSPPFKYFHREAAKHRGEVVDIDVNIRRIEKVAVTDSEKFQVKHLYEVWGWNQESQAWLYVFVTTELPPGMQEGQHVNYHSRFAGYFLKLQGYRAANAAAGKDPLVAPLLIGKFSENIPVVKSKSPFGTGQIFILIFCLVLIMFFRFTRVASFFGSSSIFPTRLKDDVEKPTDKENLEWIGSAIEPASTTDADKTS